MPLERKAVKGITFGGELRSAYKHLSKTLGASSTLHRRLDSVFRGDVSTDGALETMNSCLSAYETANFWAALALSGLSKQLF